MRVVINYHVDTYTGDITCIAWPEVHANRPARVSFADSHGKISVWVRRKIGTEVPTLIVFL